jgi:SAM-dependent methyltransferase
MNLFSNKSIDEPTDSAAFDAADHDNPTSGQPFEAFARFYDHDYRHYDDDVELILELADEQAGPVLELGCGTGRLLEPLAAAGNNVVGVDISPALLDIARNKLGQQNLPGRVQLHQADLRDFQIDGLRFAFVFCTSNTLMHLTSSADQLAVLKNAHHHLDQDGLLLIDLFNPDVQRLTQVQGVQELADRWIDEETGTQVIKWCVRSVDWADQLQETLFIYEEISEDGSVRHTPCPFTLRFLWYAEAQLMLHVAGFTLECVWGDFDGTPYMNGCERLILLARRA